MLMSADAYRESLRRCKPVVYVDDVRLTQLAAPPASLLRIERDVSVGSMLSDRFEC